MKLRVDEEGLKERGGFGEKSTADEQESATETAEQSSEDESEEEEPQEEVQQPQTQHVTTGLLDESEDEVTEEESMSRRCPTPSPRRRLGGSLVDRTMRTDRTTLASSRVPCTYARTTHHSASTCRKPRASLWPSKPSDLASPQLPASSHLS